MSARRGPRYSGGMVDVRDLRPIGFFAGCSEAEQRELAPLCRRATYRSGQAIQEENVPLRAVRAVLAGEVLIHRSSGGDAAARLAIVKPGETFGIGEVLLPTTYTGASALVACTVLEIDRDDFVRRFLAVPAVREAVVRELSRIARFLVCKVTGGGGRRDLALYLRAQAEICGQAEGSRIRLCRKQLQPEIASFLNLSREHVARLFAKLKAEGVADFNRGFPLIDRAWLDRQAPDRDLAASIQYRDLPAKR